MKFGQHILTSIILLLAVVFNSCKNDLKLNAPYKEVPSIYAVINPQDKIKIIRINRIFLGESDANKSAKIADSINYAPGELTVTLERFVEGAKVDACPTCPDGSPDKRTITFRDSMVQAVPGAFNTNQMVYVSSADLHQGLPVSGSDGLNTNASWKVSGDYVLTVKNNKTGNVFTSKTTAIDSVSGNQGIAPFYIPYYPYNAGTAPTSPPYIDYSNQEQVYSVSYTPKAGTGSVYQMVIRLHFHENVFGNISNRYVDYTLANQYPRNASTKSGQTFLTATFKGKDLFGAAAIELNRNGFTDNVSSRKIYKVQYFVYSSTDDYIDYLQFTAPSFNISQSKPLYSNFYNRDALGIFTFRARCSINKEPATSFVTEFQSNAATCKYLFLSADESRKGCN